MKKVFSFGVLFALFVSFAYAQSPEITFVNTEHNFDVIKEEDGLVNTVFEFTNTGNAPLIITNVVVGCSCTRPTFSREPILPGATGTIGGGYNPAGRPGVFNRTLTVKSNAGEDVVLRVSGDVTPRPRTED